MAKTENFSTRPVLENITNFLWKPEISVDCQKRILEIKEFLTNNAAFNFIIYFNHISLNDPAIVLHTADQISPKGHQQHLIAPVSYSHVEAHNLEAKAFNSFRKILAGAEIETIPIIQSYQINDNKGGYNLEQARTTYTKYFDRLKELQKSGERIGLLISPEGHRSDNGQLAAAEKGILFSGKILAPVIYVPLGIYYAGKYQRNSLNFGKKMTMNVGEITTQKNPRDLPNLEELMMKLAKALPQEMQGIWQETDQQ